MLDVMAERALRNLVDLTDDPNIKELKPGRDWDSFLAFLSQLFEMLMPIFDKCLVTDTEMIARAAAENRRRCKTRTFSLPCTARGRPVHRRH